MYLYSVIYDHIHIIDLAGWVSTEKLYSFNLMVCQEADPDGFC